MTVGQLIALLRLQNPEHEVAYIGWEKYTLEPVVKVQLVHHRCAIGKVLELKVPTVFIQ